LPLLGDGGWFDTYGRRLSIPECPSAVSVAMKKYPLVAKSRYPVLAK
jgi:hypothetical protein